MRIVELNGEYMDTKVNLHKYLIRKFDLPTYYGNNLDSLWDILSERSRETQITLTHPDVLVENLGWYGNKVMTIFALLDEEKENYQFTVDLSNL